MTSIRNFRRVRYQTRVTGTTFRLILLGVATPGVFDKSPVLKPGFVTTKDINSDGVDDYILDYSKLSGHSIAAQ